MKSGFVSFVGRPNVGKSTLINRLVGIKLSITSDKAHTTRNVIQGIYNDDESQIVFVDTPGIHKPLNKLGQILNKGAYYSIDDVDIVCFIIDAKKKIGRGDRFILEKLNNIKKPVILIINKIDGLSNEDIFLKINEYKDEYNFKEIVPISALKGNNTSELIKVIKNYLPDSSKYFEEEMYTNKSLKFMVSEIVREKILNLTKEEVPHSTTCITEKMVKDKDKYIINVDIIVDRDSIKRIIIGKNGNMIKKIGILAREDIEKLLDSKVYLDLYVKTVKKWEDKESYLKDLEFTDFME